MPLSLHVSPFYLPSHRSGPGPGLRAYRDCKIALPARHLSKAGTCKACPVGTFRDEGHNQPFDSCVECVAGTYNPHRGVGTEDLCRPCPHGTYSADPGASNCTPCPDGMVSGLRSKVCLVCGPGTHPPSYDKYDWYPTTPPSCKKCPSQFYSSLTSNAECTECPFGLSSPEGSTSITDCRPCPGGQEPWPDVPSGCRNCTRGFFKRRTGMGVCEQCPRGFIQPLEGKRSCDACPVGTRSHPWSERCIPCPAGTVTYSAGNDMCRNRGVPCPKFSYETPDGDCRRCAEGTVVSETNTTCVKCPLGTRSPGGGTRKCIDCPSGQGSTIDGKDCKCAQGYFISPSGTCAKCPAGSFTRDDYDGVPPTECNECEGRTVAAKAGSTTCSQCPELRVPNAQKSSCVRCPPGLTPSAEESDSILCVNITTGCLPGYRRNDVGISCTRVTCQLGTDARLVGVACLPCYPGYALLTESGSSGRRFCKRCPKGSVSEGGVISECTKCSDGMLADSDDPSTCSCRTPGHGMSGGKCAPCKRGFFSEYGDSVCHKCPRGATSMKKGSYRCKKCQPGLFKAVQGAGKCKKCGDGLLPNRFRGATRCVSA